MTSCRLLLAGAAAFALAAPSAAGEVSASRWTLDCSGADREHMDWGAVRDYIPPIGIARVRVQAGWLRTEKDPGVYNFAWLDRIVFDAARLGVQVWMGLSYGNPAYHGGGRTASQVRAFRFAGLSGCPHRQRLRTAAGQRPPRWRLHGLRRSVLRLPGVCDGQVVSFPRRVVGSPLALHPIDRRLEVWCCGCKIREISV